jgi:hypothetical protein
MTMNRPWTMGEVRRLLAMRKDGLTLAECARRLGRSVQMTFKQWQRFGTPNAYPKLTSASLQRLRALHAQGYTDRELSDALNVSKAGARAARHRLGLPSNRNSPRSRARMSTASRLQHAEARALGHNPGHASHVRRRITALYAGWPGAASPQDVRLLELLYARGPLSSPQVAQALGYSQHWYGRGANNALRRLVARGLAQRAGRSGRAQLFDLTPAARAAQERHRAKKNLD